MTIYGTTELKRPQRPQWRGVWRLAALSTLFAAASAPSHAPDLFSQQSQLMIDGNSRVHYYESNQDILSSGNTLRRVIVLVHGAGRTNITYERVLDEAVANGVQDETLIFAPQFLVDDDIAANALGPEALFWRNGWREGHLSVDNGLGRISSFELVNRIVRQIVANNPLISDVVIAGHSAGGQYAQRFAAASRLQQELETIVVGIRVRYAVANPSSYVYMSNARRVGNSVDEFAIPNSTNCVEFDDYKYGLGGDLNSFVRDIGGADQVRAQYPTRDVRYLLGEDDNDPNSSSLSKTCEANLQGEHRYERGVIYYNHLRDVFAETVHDQHQLAVSADLGHTSRVFVADCGVFFLFDIGNCPLLTPTNLTSGVAPSGAVDLNWTNHASGESGYDVLRSDDAGDSFQVLTTLSADASAYVDSSASANTQYRYRVRATHLGSASSSSNTTTANAGAPPVATNPPPIAPPPDSSGGGGATGLMFVICLCAAIRRRRPLALGGTPAIP